MPAPSSFPVQSHWRPFWYAFGIVQTENVNAKLLRGIRQKFHPLYRARKSRLGRVIIRAADRPAWISIPSVHFPVRGQLLTHKVSYGMIGSQERNPQVLAMACLKHFRFRAFWDVGANFGYYSWLLKSASPDLNIVLIEPLPDNAALIRATLQRNRFSDVKLIEAGASDHSGEGILNADEIGGATSSLDEQTTFEERHFGVAPRSIRVRVVSLDSLSEGPVDFMKIDVEGYEAVTLRGAKQVIARDQPILFVECPHPNRECLRLDGYQIVDADNLSRNCAAESTNFFCFPERHQGSIDALLETALREASKRA